MPRVLLEVMCLPLFIKLPINPLMLINRFTLCKLDYFHFFRLLVKLLRPYPFLLADSMIKLLLFEVDVSPHLPYFLSLGN